MLHVDKVQILPKKLQHYRKEVVALLMALEKFEIYLGNTNQKFIVYSDHNPQQCVSRMRNKNQRLTRCWLALQSYNMEIRHIRGKDNPIADALSRDPD